MTENTPISYDFGPFRIDAQSQQLYRENVIVPLTRKRFEILLFLVRNAGKVLRKEDIFPSVWPNQTVEESNLTQHIYLLRRDIEDDPKTPHYIQTIPGEGYRFQPNVSVTYPAERELANHSTSRSAPPNGPWVSDRVTAEEGPPGPLSDSASDSFGSVVSSRLPGHTSIILASATLLFLIAVAVVLYFRYRADSRTASIPVITPIQTSLGLKSEVAFSNDGRLLAYISETEPSNIPDIYVTAGSGAAPIRITDTLTGEHFLCWSPDNLQIAFLRWSPSNPSKYKLVTIPALGGIENEVAEVDGGIAWSPDGRFFAICDSLSKGAPTGIFLLSVDGQTRIPLSIPDDVSTFDTRPRYSPDGSRIAFTRWARSGGGDLYIVEVARQRTTRITHDRASITDFQWTRDGTQILFSSDRTGNRRLWQVAANGGEPELLNNIPPDVRHFSICPTNPNLLVYLLSLVDTTIDVVSLGDSVDGKGKGAPRRECRINSSRADDSARWSPDGQMLAFCSGRTGFTEIWVSRYDCTELRQLTSLRQVNVGSPRWSPDGRSIVFDQILNGQGEVMMVDLESRAITRMTANRTADILPSYSSDGRWIYFNSYRSGEPQIWKMSNDGSNITQVTVNGGFEAVESADAKILYYTRNGFLWKKDLTTGVESRIESLADTPIHRYWDVGVNTIFYSPSAGIGTSNIFSLNTITGQSRKLMTIDGLTLRDLPGITVSPAGTRIAVSYLSYPFLEITQIENWR